MAARSGRAASGFLGVWGASYQLSVIRHAAHASSLHMAKLFSERFKPAGTVGAVAVVCVGMLFQQSRAAKQKAASDSQLLARMQRLPLMISEHANCRMDCRCAPLSVHQLCTCSRL